MAGRARQQDDGREIVRRMFLLMDEHGISQNDIAGDLGVNQTAVSNWKVGGATPSAKVLARFPRAFHRRTQLWVNPAYLLLQSDDKYWAPDGESPDLAAHRGAITLLSDVEEALAGVRRRLLRRQETVLRDLRESTDAADRMDRHRPERRARGA